MHFIFAATPAAASSCRRRYLSLLAAAALLISHAASASAQSALDGFDPNANGSISSIVVQPDGKILIAGGFTTVAPNGGPAVTRNRVARLNPDGTLDTLFNPSVDDGVADMVLQADGKIVIGGMFLNVGGLPRARIARLDPTTGAPDSFDPSANGVVSALALQADGKILAGGDFNTFTGPITIGGQSRNRIARLDPATGMADSFNPNASSQVLALAVQSDGKILAGGQFFGHNSIGGQNRFAIARLDPATGLADSFNANVLSGKVFAIAVQPDGKILIGGSFSNLGGQTRLSIARLDSATGAPDSFNPSANGSGFGGPYVSNIVLQSDGRILVGGAFEQIGGQMRRNVARLDAASGMSDAFDPSPDGGIGAIAVQPDEKVLLGGSFTSVAPNGGAAVPRSRIARLERDGRLDATLNPGANSSVLGLAVQPDGKLLVSGFFTQLGGQPRNHIGRLNSDGTLDSTFNPNASDDVSDFAIQPDNKILIGGRFFQVGGQPRANIARLHPNGTLDTTFNPGADSSVDAFAVQADGKIVVGGTFSTLLGNQPRSFIGRLNADGTTDAAFNPGANSSVLALALQADGKIVAGGFFTELGGVPRLAIGRLNADGTIDMSFNAGAANGGIFAVAVQPDGKIVISGLFTQFGGQPRNRIARLNSDGTLDTTFNPGANERVDTIAVQADGKIIVGGNFTVLGGQSRSRIGRLSVDGTVDMSFNPGANGAIVAVALQSDGKIVVGGGLSVLGGQPRFGIGRLSNPAAALQSLSVNPVDSAITWLLSGASPDLSYVLFELSTDGINYSALGIGTRIAGGFQLTGHALPLNQNIFVRARGFYSTGGTGSVSVLHSVRNVFLSPTALVLTAAASRKTHGSAGTFDISLPLAGEPAVECRSSAGAQTLVFTFTNNVVGGNATVTMGTGSVAGTPSFSQNVMTVQLTGVTDAQKITVSLTGVTDGFGQVLPETALSMNVLVGDINGSKVVNTSDIGQVKALSGAPVDVTNFRADVAVSGAIGSSDIGLVKSRSGQSVP